MKSIKCVIEIRFELAMKNKEEISLFILSGWREVIHSFPITTEPCTQHHRRLHLFSLQMSSNATLTVRIIYIDPI